MAGRRDALVGETDDLQLTDFEQFAAVAAAVYRSALVAGCGPGRSQRIAEHAARHMVGQLRMRGYRMHLEWASSEARVVIESSRRPPAYFDELEARIVV